MSLHTLANHLQGAGRGQDSVLVHMTPHEVNGLQSLAMAHGGSLTINPETGLPEAGFLSGILPMLAGAAMTAFSGGAINPLTAGLLTGAAGTVATGSLSKGLMMGLGAYGGAGLGAGLMGGAEAAVAPAVASSTAPMVSAGAFPGMVGGAGAMAPVPGMVGAATGAANSLPVGLNAVNNAGIALPQAAQLPINAANAGNSFMPTTTGGSVVSTAPQVATNAPAQSVQSATSGWDKFSSLPGKAFDLITGSGPEADKAREEFLKQNKNYLLTGGLGVLGASREDPRQPRDPKYKVHEYDWNREFNPSSRAPGSSAERTYYADGGVTSLPVEHMSQQNAFMDNPKYPMSYQNTPQYSTNRQNPISENVVYPATDDNTNPYNGEERSMASGGIALLATGGTPEDKAKAQIGKLKFTDFDADNLAEPKGGMSASGIRSVYKTEIDSQQKEVNAIQKVLNQYIDPKTGQAKKPEYADAVTYLTGILNDQKKDIDFANQSKQTALTDFSTSTKRGGESIGTRGIASIPIKPVEPGTEKMVLQPNGTWAPEKPKPEYQKLGYGQVSATTGWDNKTAKYIEPEDITRAFEEVAGRKPTESELNLYLNSGKKMTMQGLVNSINSKTADIKIARGKEDPFTEEELQAQAKYYWGREMTKGELAAYKNKNFANFGALRNALTTENNYVDYLNKLNETQFTKENATAPIVANDVDISSAFSDILQRKPSYAELQNYLSKKISVDDLKKELKTTNEYIGRLVSDPKNVGITTNQTQNLSTQTISPLNTNQIQNLSTQQISPLTTTQIGRDDLLSPPITMTRQEMADYGKQYSSYTPVSEGLYTPQLNPLTATIEGAMPYTDVNKDLGLTGLYGQMAQQMPKIQNNMSFTPNQAVAMASPFGNANPANVTLQSAAAPSAKSATSLLSPEELALYGYTQASPIIPGSKTNIASLTPAQQQLLSAAQSQPQNKSKKLAAGGYANGGYHLGDYSDGGRLLKGPGDGVSDSIPASIGNKQPARLADGEFVIPARIVSEIGNGSTDAGARKLYAMMERVQRARNKTVGRGKVAVKSGADNMLPA
jgi:hypothetical protein